MGDYSLNITNATREEIADQLRTSLKQYDDPKLIVTRHFIVGFLFGCAFIAALNFGDVLICAGSCHGNIDQIGDTHD